MGPPQTTLDLSDDDPAVPVAIDRARVAAGNPGNSPEVWAWRARNPAGRLLASARDAEGRPLAAIAGSRHRVLMAGERVEWIEITDLWNDFEAGAGLCRARPLLDLAAAFAEAHAGRAPDGCPVLYGLPDRRAHRLGLRHLSWEILRSEYALCAELSRVAPVPDATVEVQEAERFPEEATAAFERLAEGRDAILVRDTAHLNWRYPDHPDRTYRIGLARRGGELCGWGVYRAGGWGPERAGLLCEWFVAPGDRGTACELVAWAADLARADGFEWLTTVVSGKSPEWGLGQDIGFRARGTDEYLVFRSFQKPYVMSWLFGGWFYTLGDTERG